MLKYDKRFLLAKYLILHLHCATVRASMDAMKPITTMIATYITDQIIFASSERLLDLMKFQ